LGNVRGESCSKIFRWKQVSIMFKTEVCPLRQYTASAAVHSV